MIEGKRVLAIIPARGGSLRLPRKNVLPFAGKPLIVWTVEAARASRYIDRVILSSDDEEAMAVVRASGGDVPFRRPDALATSSASSSSVVHHALEALGEHWDMVVLLQPTSPLRRAQDIDACIEKAAETEGGSCITVSRLPKPPAYFGRLESDVFSGHDFFGEATPCIVNGAVYAINTVRFCSIDGFVEAGTRAHVMDWADSIDIDDAEEFRLAEALMQARGSLP